MDDVVTESRNPISKFFAKIGRQKRYMRVSSIAIKHGMGKYLALKRSPEADRKLATSLRNTLEECGGVFIKFGQVLSTRSDLLPPVFYSRVIKPSGKCNTFITKNKLKKY